MCRGCGGVCAGAMSINTRIALYVVLMVCSCSTVSICGDAYVPSVDVLLALLDHTIWLHFGTCKMALHQIKRRCWMQVIT